MLLLTVEPYPIDKVISDKCPQWIRLFMAMEHTCYPAWYSGGYAALLSWLCVVERDCLTV